MKDAEVRNALKCLVDVVCFIGRKAGVSVTLTDNGDGLPLAGCYPPKTLGESKGIGLADLNAFMRDGPTGSIAPGIKTSQYEEEAVDDCCRDCYREIIDMQKQVIESQAALIKSYERFNRGTIELKDGDADGN